MNFFSQSWHTHPSVPIDWWQLKKTAQQDIVWNSDDHSLALYHTEYFRFFLIKASLRPLSKVLQSFFLKALHHWTIPASCPPLPITNHSILGPATHNYMEGNKCGEEGQENDSDRTGQNIELGLLWLEARTGPIF